MSDLDYVYSGKSTKDKHCQVGHLGSRGTLSLIRARNLVLENGNKAPKVEKENSKIRKPVMLQKTLMGTLKL